VKPRILLADDSPHAQRMGERILREEGYEVVSVTDGESALVRWRDFDPDLVIADVSLPLKSGYDLCRDIKNDPKRNFTKVILTAGSLELFSHDQAREAGSDGLLRKPFEASSMMETVETLVESARFARKMFGELPAETADEPDEPPAPVAWEASTAAPQPAPATTEPAAPPHLDPSLVRAAVTLAVEAAIPALIDEITQKVVDSLEDSTAH